jgi:hypothetical protein
MGYSNHQLLVLTSLREPKTFKKNSKSASYTKRDAALHGISTYNFGNLRNQTFSDIKSKTMKDVLVEIRDIFTDKKYEEPEVFFHINITKILIHGIDWIQMYRYGPSNISVCSIKGLLMVYEKHIKEV